MLKSEAKAELVDRVLYVPSRRTLSALFFIALINPFQLGEDQPNYDALPPDPTTRESTYYLLTNLNPSLAGKR
jgi:hypothetical protein